MAAHRPDTECDSVPNVDLSNLNVRARIALFLPRIQGRFSVGVTTFVTPVRPPQSIGTAKLKRSAGKKQEQPSHALFLEEVAFTAYYPADVSAASKKGVPWFLRPIRESLHGFAAFLGLPSWLLWPVVYLFGAFLRIPAYPNAPLLSPSKADINASQWPLVIFSHGLGGGRTVYSQFCSRLAASGKIVLAVEHRDGTGTVCMPRSWNQGMKSGPRPIFYLRETDIHWDDSDKIDTHPIPLRGQQLVFRHHEVHIAYSTFCRFLRNDPTLDLETIDGSPFDKSSWLSSDQSSDAAKVRYQDGIVFTGHSFGGCTVLSLLSTEPLEGYAAIPVERVVILDPWLEPLPSPGPTPFPRKKATDEASVAEESVRSSVEGVFATENGTPNGRSLHPRMLVINSEAFTIWKDHFARLQEVVAGWEPEGGKILTLVGSAHVSFSDFPVLPIIRKKTAQPILDTIAKLSLAFLEDKLDEALETLPKTKMEVKIVGVKKDGKPKRKLVGNVGDVIVL
ncbi:unnamed protein product [Cyclocybe aegerita]|uniref:1-alkyl-2-acetylglycerophosphocholine esterase n=1 Tax=Cyclocybe aegerita TaxID=1973307 RepID=A0A8S0W7D5_CYCAE|nr:unnamed protein product [Cyclocybe aegerita]